VAAQLMTPPLRLTAEPAAIRPKTPTPACSATVALPQRLRRSTPPRHPLVTAQRNAAPHRLWGAERATRTSPTRSHRPRAQASRKTLVRAAAARGGCQGRTLPPPLHATPPAPARRWRCKRCCAFRSGGPSGRQPWPRKLPLQRRPPKPPPRRRAPRRGRSEPHTKPTGEGGGGGGCVQLCPVPCPCPDLTPARILPLRALFLPIANSPPSPPFPFPAQHLDRQGWAWPEPLPQLPPAPVPGRSLRGRSA
jgi:hypothetical protein